MGFQLASRLPVICLVVVIHIAEQQAFRGFVDDEPVISARPHRPEIPILRLVQFVETHASTRGIHLQIKSRRLGRLLLVASQAGKAVGEGVGDEEGHATKARDSRESVSFQLPLRKPQNTWRAECKDMTDDHQ